MSGPSGTWTTTSGGGVGAALAVLAPAAVVCAIAYATAQAVAAIPAWVWALVPVAVFTVTMAAGVFLVRHNRRKGAELAAMFAARHAVERAAAEARELRNHQARLEDHQRALEVAAASAPVIQNHVHLGALADLVRGYTPATVITDTKEIPR